MRLVEDNAKSAGELTSPLVSKSRQVGNYPTFTTMLVVRPLQFTPRLSPTTSSTRPMWGTVMTDMVTYGHISIKGSSWEEMVPEGEIN